jgi:hypothetical protein
VELDIYGWLRQKFGSNAASRIFFGWLAACVKFGLDINSVLCAVSRRSMIMTSSRIELYLHLGAIVY